MSVKGLAQGICPRCGSTEVTKESGLVRGPYFEVQAGHSGSARKSSYLDTFVCGSCGYVEFYYVPTDEAKKAFKESKEK